MRVTIGSRNSALAKIQAIHTGNGIKAHHPDIEIVYNFRASVGDLDQSTPLWKTDSRGIFSSEFVDDLTGGKSDIIVHSYKDLPVETNDETHIVCVPPRADARDLVLIRKDRYENVMNGADLSVLSSSPRRQFNLARLLPALLPGVENTLSFNPVRGNVPTRMRKLLDGTSDALVVAKAAIDRLLTPPDFEDMNCASEIKELLDTCYWMVLPLMANPTAPAQGALAVECLRSRNDLKELLQPLHCQTTADNAAREREVLSGHGGGCHQKIGVSALQRTFGRIEVTSGMSESGTLLDACHFTAEDSTRIAPPESITNLWVPGAEEPVFSRTPLTSTKPAGPMFVSSAYAIPREWEITPEQIVWTPGIATWKRLATRGIWVHGCSEGFGSQESPGIDLLHTPGSCWTTVTHDEAPSRPDCDTIHTYHLTPIDFTLPKQVISHVFWRSGTCFRHVTNRYPELKSAWHACGPGSTYSAIKSELNNPGKLEMFLDSDSWFKEMERRIKNGY
jgi:hydroxymethylbilane synthase